MSNVCRLVFQLAAEVGPFSKGRQVVRYAHHQFHEFLALAPDEQVKVLTAFLGEAVVAHLEGARGICVVPGGEFLEGAKGHWVKCRAERAEDAIEAVISWVSQPPPEQQALAHEMRTLLLTARWHELARALENVPELHRYSALLLAKKERGPRPQLSSPEVLAAFVAPGAKISSVTESAGSRAMVREHRSLRVDIFGDFFGAHFSEVLTKSAFADAMNRICIMQYEVNLDVRSAQAFFANAFLHDEMKYETREMVRTKAFVMSARSDTRTFVLKYDADEGSPRAIVTAVGVVAQPPSALAGE